MQEKTLFKKISAKYKSFLKARNARLNKEEYEEKAIILKSNPTTYIIGLTNVCHLKCPLCETGARIDTGRTKGYMDYNLAEKIVNKIKDYALWVWLHNWGGVTSHFCKYLNKPDKLLELSMMLRVRPLVRTRLKKLKS